MYLTLYLGGGALLALLVLLALPREACLALGAAGLALGVLLPVAIWTWAALMVTGDDSAYGMLGTLLVILFAPAGLLMFVGGLFKRS